MTTDMYRGALYCNGVLWAPALPDAPATAPSARVQTYERPVPQVVEREYTYVEAIPSKDVMYAAQNAHKIACRELNLSGISLGFFGLASGRPGEEVVAASPYSLMGFTHPASDSIWINVAQEAGAAAKAVAHECKHRHVLNAFPGISKESRETAARNYTARFWAAHSTAFGWAQTLGRQLGRE